MKRRTFIGTAAAGAGALGLPALSACNSPQKKEPSGEEFQDDFELKEWTAAQLQNAMKQGKYTSRQITGMYLKRIQEIDHSGPSLHSVIELNPDALQIADEMDKERKTGKSRGPMHGIPVLIKDNIDTADKMSTTAGSLALAGSIAMKDAFIVARLREAGAVLLGKTNLSEWANIRSSRSTSGWSGRGGQTHNPYVTDRNPCGSSSGSGVAVSANLCTIAIGTETDGSIVCPSSTNGIVGIKPTVGLWSRSGIIPISHSQDTAGPMARSVEDAATLLGLLTGMDQNDSATLDSEGEISPDYTRFLDPNGLRGARIGVARSFFGFHPVVDKLMDQAIQQMKELGAVMVDPVEIKNLREIEGSEFEVLLYELKADLNKYLAGLRPEIPYRTLKDLIAFNEKNKDKEMPWFGQETFLAAEAKGELTDKAYTDALAKCREGARQKGIDATLHEHKLDAIIAPTGSPAWPTDWINGDHFTGGSSSPAAVAGYPAITVPAGFVDALPVGITFMGTAWSEPVLIRLAYAYEQKSGNRKAPGFLQTLKFL